MPEIKLSSFYDCFCSKCGKDISSSVDISNKLQKITIEPCEDCLQQIYEEGLIDGDPASGGL